MRAPERGVRIGERLLRQRRLSDRTLLHARGLALRVERRVLRGHHLQRRHVHGGLRGVRRRRSDLLRRRHLPGGLCVRERLVPSLWQRGPELLPGRDLRGHARVRLRHVHDARPLRRPPPGVLQRKLVQPGPHVRLQHGLQPRPRGLRRRRSDVLRHRLQPGPRVHLGHLSHEHHHGVRRRNAGLLRWHGLQLGPLVPARHVHPPVGRNACALRRRRADLLRRRGVQCGPRVHRRRVLVVGSGRIGRGHHGPRRPDARPLR